MSALGATTKADKTHKAFDTLALLQAHISGSGNKYEWGSSFTVTDDPTPANNADYKLVKGYDDDDKTNSANLKIEVQINSDGVGAYELLTGSTTSGSAAGTNKRIYNYTTSATQLTRNVSNSDVFNNTTGGINTIIEVEVTVMGIRADGTAGYYKKMRGIFRKDGTANAVQMGATTDIQETTDDTLVPTATIATSSNNLNVSCNTNDVSIGYNWKIILAWSYSNEVV